MSVLQTCQSIERTELICINPVSYTHLDVYKRQTHNVAKSSSKKGASTSSKDSTENHRAYLEGESDAAKQLYNYVGLVAPTNMSVLINGSSGTGKEYVAHRICLLYTSY